MAFNEEDTLENTAKEIHSVLESLGDNNELLIINDGSLDKTREVCENLSASLKNTRIIYHEKNMGLGEVYRTGFKNARCECLTFFPADGQFPAKIIKELAGSMENTDMVLGYITNSERPLIAGILSTLEKILYGALFGPLPKFQGVMMFRKSMLDKIELVSMGRGWSIVMELIIKAKRGGYKIKSIPTVFRKREKGSSKVTNLRAIWSNLTETLRLRFKI